LCRKTDHKTADNFKAQWKYAPLYVDRLEALQYFADNKMVYELSLGLNDKFYGIRSFTLDALKEIPEALSNTDILKTIERIAQNDDHNRTKSRAVAILADTKDAKYKYIFDKAVNDSSYSVAGAALKGLSNLDSAIAYTLAKKYAVDAKGDLANAVNEIMIAQGSEDDYDMIAKAYEALPLGQEKIQSTMSFCDYLSKLNDTQKIKNGVDEVIAFRNSIPQQYRKYTDAPINAALQKVADAKGSDVQAYIQTQMK
jgi:aminopeptidase N